MITFVDRLPMVAVSNLCQWSEYEVVMLHFIFRILQNNYYTIKKVFKKNSALLHLQNKISFFSYLLFLTPQTISTGHTVKS